MFYQNIFVDLLFKKYIKNYQQSDQRILTELGNVSIRLVKCKWQYRFKKDNAKNFYL